MGVAALWEELHDDEDFEDGAVSLGGSLVDFGVPFLPGILTGARLGVQFAFGADPRSREPQTWNFFDVTTDVRQSDGNGISISPFGRSDEFSTSQPAGCTFELDNSTGAYSKKLPTGKWYPNIKRNVPMRILLNLTGNAADTQVLYQGNVTGWVPGWDETGVLAIVTVTVNGTLRRIQQGKSPLRSALYRQITTTTPQPLNYWSFEDGASSTQAADAFGSGAAPISFDQSGAATAAYPKFAALTATVGANLAGSGPLPDFSNNANGRGVAVRTASTNDFWCMEFVAQVKLRDANSNIFDMVTWHQGGSSSEWTFTIDNVGTVNVYNDLGTFPVFFASVDVYDGQWRHYRLTSAKSGTSVVMTMYINNVQVATTTISSFTMGAITDVGPFRDFGALNDGRSGFGHLAVYDQTPPVNNYTAWLGWVGELSTDRLIRLFNEQGIPIRVTGSSNITMGVQGIDTFDNLIRECETADDGILYDGAGAGCAYISRMAKYNQTAALTLNFVNGDVDDPFVPADDDQRNRNLVKVDRKDGSSATYEDTSGEEGTDEIDVYDSSVTVNVSTDTYLLDRAQWEVAKGTAGGGYRYPTMSLDLASSPALIAKWAKIFIGARIDATGVESVVPEHPPGTLSLLLEGYSMFLNQFEWKVGANCSPYSPYRVGVVGTDRLQTAGSTLASDVAVGANTLSVNVTGQLWSTSAGDYPSVALIDGIQVKVTAVSGASSPQTFTVDPATVIIPLHAGDVVTVYQPLLVSL